jgi:hypothetical protein
MKKIVMALAALGVPCAASACEHLPTPVERGSRQFSSPSPVTKGSTNGLPASPGR